MALHKVNETAQFIYSWEHFDVKETRSLTAYDTCIFIVSAVCIFLCRVPAVLAHKCIHSHYRVSIIMYLYTNNSLVSASRFPCKQRHPSKWEHHCVQNRICHLAPLLEPRSSPTDDTPPLRRLYPICRRISYPRRHLKGKWTVERPQWQLHGAS